MLYCIYFVSFDNWSGSTTNFSTAPATPVPAIDMIIRAAGTANAVFKFLFLAPIKNVIAASTHPTANILYRFKVTLISVYPAPNTRPKREKSKS